jgi:hypothetical protein
MEQITEGQKKYFQNKAHAKAAGFYFTSDGVAFYTLNPAQVQATNLKKKGKSDAIAQVTRAQYEAQLTAEKEAGTTDPSAVQAQQEADQAQTDAVIATLQLTQDTADEKTASEALTLAQATGDATAIANAQAKLTQIQAKANQDAIDAANKKRVANDKKTGKK